MTIRQGLPRQVFLNLPVSIFWFCTNAFSEYFDIPVCYLKTYRIGIQISEDFSMTTKQKGRLKVHVASNLLIKLPCHFHIHFLKISAVRFFSLLITLLNTGRLISYCFPSVSTHIFFKEACQCFPQLPTSQH